MGCAMGGQRSLRSGPLPQQVFKWGAKKTKCTLLANHWEKEERWVWFCRCGVVKQGLEDMKFGSLKGGEGTLLSDEAASQTQRWGYRRGTGNSTYCLQYSQYWARQFVGATSFKVLRNLRSSYQSPPYRWWQRVRNSFQMEFSKILSLIPSLGLLTPQFSLFVVQSCCFWSSMGKWRELERGEEIQLGRSTPASGAMRDPEDRAQVKLHHSFYQFTAAQCCWLTVSGATLWFPTIPSFNQQIFTKHCCVPDTILGAWDKTLKNKTEKDHCPHRAHILELHTVPALSCLQSWMSWSKNCMLHGI